MATARAKAKAKSSSKSKSKSKASSKAKSKAKAKAKTKTKTKAKAKSKAKATSKSKAKATSTSTATSTSLATSETTETNATLTAEAGAAPPKPALPIPTPPGVVWTPDGRAGYEAELGGRGEDLFDGDPTPVVAARLRKVTAGWKAGKAKADERGRAWADLACAWKPGAKANVEQIAAMLSLASATSDDDVWSPFAALVVRDYGFETAMKVMIACWSHDVHWDKNKAWLTYRPDDHQHIHDATFREPKGALARYMQKLHRAGSATDREAIERAVDAVWTTAPRHAKTALALASNDATRAAEIARVLLADDRPHAFYAWHELPHLLADAELVEQTMAKRDESMSFRIVANLGLDALPLFEAGISGISQYSRVRLLQQLASLVSPRAARILAEYAEEKPYAETVRTYFALHAELLDAMLADQELRYYHDDLVKLKQLSAP